VRCVRDAFDRWVAAADGPMIAVTASADDEVDACLVGFHCQASIAPRRYAVWLSKRNHTYRLARRATVVGVHLLGADQRALAAQLGGVSLDDDAGKLDGIPRRRHPSGAVLLTECTAWFAGAVVGYVPGGDHRGLILEPLAASAARLTALRLGDVVDIDPGHDP
jgi:flavin reductase (DIM6/NTAB) family NADH-FMN oxidoreductase RutF